MAAITDISQHYVRSPLAHTVITPLPKSDKVRSIKRLLLKSHWLTSRCDLSDDCHWLAVTADRPDKLW